MPKSVEEVRFRMERERELGKVELPSGASVAPEAEPRATSAGSGEAGVDVSAGESEGVRALKSNGRRGTGRKSGGLGSSMAVLKGQMP